MTRDGRWRDPCWHCGNDRPLVAVRLRHLDTRKYRRVAMCRRCLDGRPDGAWKLAWRCVEVREPKAA
jgi:hypothetical protein